MKIVYLTDQIYLHGGVEKVLSQKANYLVDVSRDEVTIVTYRQQGHKPVYVFSDKIKMLDLAINYEIKKSYFHPINLNKLPRHAGSLRKILKNLEPDVIISCSFGPDFYFLPFLTGSIPVIKEFHSSRYFSAKEQLSRMKSVLKNLTNYIEGKYAALVVLNSDELPFYHSHSISVIPNPTDNVEQAAALDHKQILAAGRISPVKNFSDLIEAFARLSAAFPEWELHFWGEDYVGTQAALEHQIQGLLLQERVKFMGITHDLKAEMINYSIYAMTSETECFPMVLLESLSAGLPVVTYDSPTGPRHIVTDNEDGYIVPYNNLDIFTQKLKELMTDQNFRIQMGAKGRENVQRFSIDKVMQQWKNIFNILVGS